MSLLIPAHLSFASTKDAKMISATLKYKEDYLCRTVCVDTSSLLPVKLFSFLISVTVPSSKLLGESGNH